MDDPPETTRPPEEVTVLLPDEDEPEETYEASLLLRDVPPETLRNVVEPPLLSSPVPPL